MKGTDIILKPVISEKSLADVKNKKYTFIVDQHASKNEIARSVAEQFGVDVEKVYTSIIKKVTERMSRFGRKSREYSYKKARVQVKKDQSISIFEEVVE